MNKLVKFVTPLHTLTKRNYINRMMSEKVKCMTKAKKYGKDYWDGKRKYGYGGYKYIPNRWKPVAQKIIKKYNLTGKSKILDVGCGKGFLLYEIKKILPKIKIVGFDISKYGINNAKKEIRKYLFAHDAKKKYPFKNKNFDLVISLGCLHNFKLYDLYNSIKEIQRVGNKAYIMVEGYRNSNELFNLQCWALTAETFFDDNEWKWLFKVCGYKGDYEFIYFK